MPRLTVPEALRERSLLAAGLSPALQRTWRVDGLVLGSVNRIGQTDLHATGKAANVARAAQCLGARSVTVCPVGGSTGEDWLQRMAAEHLDAVGIPTPNPTRICATLIDPTTHQITELVEENAPPSDETLNAWRAAILSRAATAHAFVLAGNLPPRTDPAIYTSLLTALPPSLATVVVDTSGPAALAARECPRAVLKMNRQEWDLTCRAANRALDPRAFAPLVITDAERTITAWMTRETVLHIEPTTIPDPVNTTGCGDAFTAALALALSVGIDAPEALRLAADCASASARSAIPGLIDLQDIA